LFVLQSVDFFHILYDKVLEQSSLNFECGKAISLDHPF